MRSLKSLRMQPQKKVSKMGYHICPYSSIDNRSSQSLQETGTETHPDRLPQGATDEKKAISEEKFRKVNEDFDCSLQWDLDQIG
jgi:hypothetical protein